MSKIRTFNDSIIQNGERRFYGDSVCGKAVLTKVDHAMAKFTIANDFRGTGLGTTWKIPDKSSSFVGNFHLND